MTVRHHVHHMQGAPTTFQDLDGLHIMVERLALEAGVCAPTPVPASDSSPEVAGGSLSTEGAQAMATDDVPTPPFSSAASGSAVHGEGAGAGAAAGAEPSAPPAAPPAIQTKDPPRFPAPLLSALQVASAPPPSVALPYPRKVLLKFLIRSIAITSYSHGTANAARPSEVSVKEADSGTFVWLVTGRNHPALWL
jgi:hypothetical protein